MAQNIKRVVVLGAGASCSYLESPTKLKPPLAKEIISTFRKLDISENRLVLIGYILNYVRDTRGISPANFYDWDEDLESFFSEIDEKVTEFAEKLKNHEKITKEKLRRYHLAVATYSELIFLFTSIFNEIQNGPLSSSYELLINELNDNDVVVTFNWDTLLDRALYMSNRWSPDIGYCIKPEFIFNNEWIKPEEFKIENNSISYLKLHGSTNWLTPYHSINFSTGEDFSFSKYGMEKLFVFLKSTGEYKTYINRYWGPYKPFSYCYYPPNLPLVAYTKPGKRLVMVVSAFDLHEHGKIDDNVKDVFSMPLLVPPIRNKQYKKYGKIFNTLWDLAEKSIEHCNELYIIGYSFPKTDIASKEMFKKALVKNKMINKIIIINPNPKNIEDIFLKELKIDNSKVEIRQKKFIGTLK